MKHPRLYDSGMSLLAILENASVRLDALKLNDLSRVSFTLPSADPKNDLCLDRRFVEVFDGEESAGIFRVTGSPESDATAPGGVIRYEAEHAIATLLDDVFPEYTEYGGSGISTLQSIAFILSKQTVARWQAGSCAYDKAFQHKWEHDDLLTALFSVARPFEDCRWAYDFGTAPWTVHLTRMGTQPECEVRFRRNMKGVARARDSRTYITKLYCLGYGEGVNQLSIQSVNGGKKYLLADTYDPADPASGVFVDAGVEDPALLKSLGEEVLRRTKTPKYSYRVSAADLYRATGLEWDRFSEGRMLRVYDGKGSFTARVVQVSKPDPAGDPGNVELTLANGDGDLADVIGSLADRAKINLLASQGATNLYAQQFGDNCDKDSPARLRFYVPGNCVRINRVLLSWEYEPFRAYSKGNAAAGSAAVTSESSAQPVDPFEGNTDGIGGITPFSTSSNGALLTEFPSAAYNTGTTGLITNAGGAGATGAAGANATGENSVYNTGGTGLITNDAGTGATGASAGSTGSAGTGSTGAASSGYTGFEDGSGSHNHGMAHTHSGPSHSHSLNDHTHAGPSHAHSIDNHTHTVGGHTHLGPSHAHSLPDHAHSVDNHTHLGGDHRHFAQAHAHTVPAHTHDMTHGHMAEAHSHSVTIPGHNHGIVYGIYEGPSVDAAALKVDGASFPFSGTDGLDITAGLSVDGEGRILRGAWHEVEIAPLPRDGNPEALTRIAANLFVQTFIQSVGGGDH